MELDEVKEILKVTKEINRELMDEINGKEYILSECRKFYAQVIGSKSNPEFKNLKSLLNLKQWAWSLDITHFLSSYDYSESCYNDQITPTNELRGITQNNRNNSSQQGSCGSFQ